MTNPGDPLDLFRLLDIAAALAWPAAVQQPLDGWLLRATNGVTRRANSVLSAAPLPADPDWLTAVEDFYYSRGLPARFQVSDGSPYELAAILAAHGYMPEAETMVQVAEAARVVEGTISAQPVRLRTATALEDAWLDAFIEVEGVGESKKATYRSIYEGIQPDTLYLMATSDSGDAVAIGMAVSEGEWTGLFSIATRPDHRGLGIATRIMGELARWSIDRGSPNLYLQVMENNTVAVRLYEKLGFSRLYGYHYRTKF